MLDSGKKMKIYPQVLTFSLEPQNWQLHLVVLKTKVNNGRQMNENETSPCRACKYIANTLLLLINTVYFDSRFLSMSKLINEKKQICGVLVAFAVLVS